MSVDMTSCDTASCNEALGGARAGQSWCMIADQPGELQDWNQGHIGTMQTFLSNVSQPYWDISQPNWDDADISQQQTFPSAAVPDNARYTWLGACDDGTTALITFTQLVLRVHFNTAFSFAVC